MSDLDLLAWTAAIAGAFEEEGLPAPEKVEEKLMPFVFRDHVIVDGEWHFWLVRPSGDWYVAKTSWKTGVGLSNKTPLSSAARAFARFVKAHGRRHTPATPPAGTADTTVPASEAAEATEVPSA